MRRLKSKENQKSKFYLIIIYLIAFLSIGKIINYYFFYDDFFLFYAIQFPNDKESIFLSPDASAYRFLQPFFTPLFNLFTYQPKGYFIISFILFVIFLGLFYLFVKTISPREKILPLFATTIMASGYIGIEAFTWNMGAGINNTMFLFSSFITLLFIALYLKNKTSMFLFGMIFVFLFTVYFFQFRAFLLFLWIALFLTAYFLKKDTIPRKLVVSTLFVFVVGLFLYKSSFGFNQGQALHTQFNVFEFLRIYLRNIGNLFFPAELIQFLSERNKISLDIVELSVGILSFLLVVLISIKAFFLKMKEFPLIFFFSTGLIFSLFFLQLVIGLTVNSPDVWYSQHRFYIVILPFLAGFLGIALVVLGKRFKSLSLILLTIWITVHVFLSNKAIDNRWENSIGHIKYFYTNISEFIPKLDKNSVLLVQQGEPTPVSIFVSARAANAYAGIAGFYGMKVSDLNLARSAQEAVKMLNDLNLSEENLYSLHYRRGELINLTDETKQLLKVGKRKFLGSGAGNIVEFDRLSLPAYAPLYADFKLQVVPDFSSLDLLKVTTQKEILEPEKYFPLLIASKHSRVKMRSISINEPLSSEHEAQNIIDGNYETTWIPLKWDNRGVSVTVDLGELKLIDKVIWSSSRTASWYVRMPSSYKVEISKDGNNFKEVFEVNDAPVLKTGEFFENIFLEQEVRFVKITIFRTRGGLSPAIDEIETFGKEAIALDLSEYFTIRQNPERYLQDIQTAENYLKELLGNRIDVEIGWRVDGNTDYPIGQSITIPTSINNPQEIHISLPITGLEAKSLRIKPSNFPAKLLIENANIIYPRLMEFSKAE